VNFEITNNPNTKVHIDDGRSYLEGNRREFDVIISQPSNPWVSGVSSLFTKEFIKEVKNRLGPEGIFCQWMQGYHIPPQDLKLIFRTFQGAFPEATLWEGSRGDYILIGREAGNQKLDFNQILDRLEANPSVLKTFEKYGVSPVEEFLTSFRLGSDALSSFTGEGPENTDDLTLLEFNAPKFLYQDFGTEILSEIMNLRKSSFPSFIHGRKLESMEAHLKLGEYLMNKGRFHLSKWEFNRVPPLTTMPLFQGDTAEEPLFYSNESVVEIFEDFDSIFPIPLLPRVGTYRPGLLCPNFWSCGKVR
jgi:hypothetical protein